jgi:hypothetical protein
MWLEFLMEFPAIYTKCDPVPEPSWQIAFEPWPEWNTCDNPKQMVLVPWNDNIRQAGPFCIDEVPDEFVDEGEEVGSSGCR